MGKPVPKRNGAQYYGGQIHCFFSNDEGRLTFCESYELNLVHNKALRRHPGSTVHYFIIAGHTLQRKLISDCTRDFSPNTTSHEGHCNQES